MPRRSTPLALLVASLMLTVPSGAFAQDVARPPSRVGFVFGAAVGVSRTALSGPGVDGRPHLAPSFPDVQFGHMLSDRVAMLVLLPGSTYTYDSNNAADRVRTRGFEGIVPSVQYWVADRMWVKGGVGLALDAPAFYDIRNASERAFHFGPGFSVSTGVEAWRRARHAVDLRAQWHGGRVPLPGGAHHQGSVLSVLVGVTRY